MITYPTFVDTLAKRGIDLNVLAADSGVDIATIRAVMNGRVPVSITAGKAIARALGVPAKRLWALPPDLEQVNARLGARRYITDPETLRIVDRKRGAA